MTNAQKKVNDAREAFQKEMDAYGLKVEHGSSCHYVVGAKAVTFSTVALPAKGQKKLIEDLRAAGCEVWTFKVEDKDGKRYMKFRAYKTVKIKTAADDAEEYVEQKQQEKVGVEVSEAPVIPMDSAEKKQEVKAEQRKKVDVQELKRCMVRDAIEAARRMNDQYGTGDVERNHMNCGEMTHALKVLRLLGYEATDATWEQGGLLVCEKITVDGEMLYRR